MVRVKFCEDFKRVYQIELDSALLCDYPTLAQLAAYLVSEYPDRLARHFQLLPGGKTFFSQEKEFSA
jgi:hypothetical protein